MKHLLMFFMLLALASPSQGRPLRPWTYQQLVDEADLVIVARPISTQDLKEKEKQPVAPTDGLVAIATELEIQGVMKGDKSLKKCTVLHFRYKDLKKIPVNGPGLLLFDPKYGPGLLIFGRRQPETFLLFLRKRVDNGYVAVSGQMDPDQSVMRLDTSWAFRALDKAAEKTK